MTLPLLLSVPHAGLVVPEEAAPYCRLSHEEIVADGDVGAAEIYDLEDHVARFITTDVARAIVDLNRAADDRRADGVVKTHTCWNVPVYEPPPPLEALETLLAKYYHPYHDRLREAMRESMQAGDVRLCVDCHTMAAEAPPIGPEPGSPRPKVCLGDANGTTLPLGWMDLLADCFRRGCEGAVTVNNPFSGGYITRTHGKAMPWVQVELSRGPFMTNAEKRGLVRTTLTAFCDEVL